MTTNHDRRGPIRSQTSHRFQSCFESAVIVLDPVVRVLGGIMQNIRKQFIDHAQQRWSEIGRDFFRTFVAGQDRREERSCCGQIASFRNVHVDDLAVLVDRPIHLPPNTSDFHVGLINEPAVTDTVTARSRSVDQQRCEALNPSVDRDVINIDPAFREELFHVTI